jgi:hypothetical protein
MKQNYPDQGQLLKLFITSLSTTYQQALTQRENTDEQREAQKEIETILKSISSWREAYRAEQLMIPLLPSTILQAVLSRQLLRAKRLGEDVALYYSERNETTQEDDEKRTLLRQLTQDLQGHDELLRIKQHYIHNSWEIVSCAFIISFILFFSPSIISPLTNWLYNIGVGHGRALDIFTAISSGALGASFSMLIGLQSRLEGSPLYILEAMQKKNYVFFRVFTGMGAGLIFFYFMQSGLLEGSIFPEWYPINEATTVLVHNGSKDLALLIIWCFLSGFSEKLLPSMLSKTEGQANARTLEQV